MDGARDGRFLFSGVASNAGSAQPSNPLTAKLVKAEFWSTARPARPASPRVSAAAARPPRPMARPSSPWAPRPRSVSRTARPSSTARRPRIRGIDRIDLYVNNVRVKTCNDAICDFESTYYTNGASLRTVTLYARATDKSGWSTGTPSESLTVDLNGTGIGHDHGQRQQRRLRLGLVLEWQFLRTDQTTTFTANASDMDGIQRIEVFVNGNLVKASRRPHGHHVHLLRRHAQRLELHGWPDLSVSARVTDAYGYQTWSSTNSLSVVNPGYNSGNGTISGSLSSTVLPKDRTLTYTVNAYPYGSVGSTASRSTSTARCARPARSTAPPTRPPARRPSRRELRRRFLAHGAGQVRGHLRIGPVDLRPLVPGRLRELRQQRRGLDHGLR